RRRGRARAARTRRGRRERAHLGARRRAPPGSRAQPRARQLLPPGHGESGQPPPGEPRPDRRAGLLPPRERRDAGGGSPPPLERSGPDRVLLGPARRVGSPALLVPGTAPRDDQRASLARAGL